ncbi:MAG: YegS/Rv2252/BmrU family lipid kinase [Candidatus Azobacteroides sp.]|nr:YegS/Rv2252/BmrU family lipid kinase [Candidatus Azobacteroides sp.]
MSKKKVLVIINPISGTSGKKQLPSTIYNHPLTANFDFDIRTSEYKGHAKELAREAVENFYEYVLAVGGDGTVNEIACELVQSETALGIIPLGSGNGLARHLGIPIHTKKALEVFLSENVTAVDYCKANDKFFFATFGVGLDAKVSEAFSESKTRGLITYVANSITEFAKLKPEKYTITTYEGESFTRDAILITCANASQWGYNAYVAPKASVQDGLLDMVILFPFPIMDAPSLGIQLMTKNIDKNNYVKIIKTKEVIIEREKEEVAQVDGEPILLGNKIEIKTYKGGLKAIVPRII